MRADHKQIMRRSAEDYYEEYDEKMLEDLMDQLSGVVTEDVRDIVEEWYNTLPDAGQWSGEKAWDEYTNAMEDKADAMRDELNEQD